MDRLRRRPRPGAAVVAIPEEASGIVAGVVCPGRERKRGRRVRGLRRHARGGRWGLRRRVMLAEAARLRDATEHREHWKRWGPYLSERAWGTVRQDYSPDRDAWHYFPH